MHARTQTISTTYQADLDLYSIHMPPMAPFTFLVVFSLLSSSSSLIHGSSDQTTAMKKASVSRDIVAETCKLCADRDANVNYAFCVESLGSVRNSHRADRKGLAVIALKLAVSDARDVGSKVQRLLKAKPLSNYTKSCLETCRELYSDAVASLEDSVAAVRSGRYKDANVRISSAVDAPGECEEGFKDGEGSASSSSPLTKENDEFFKRATLALAITALG